MLERLGAVGAVVSDNVDGSSSAHTPLFSMSGDGGEDVGIPVLFLFKEDAK